MRRMRMFFALRLPPVALSLAPSRLRRVQQLHCPLASWLASMRMCMQCAGAAAARTLATPPSDLQGLPVTSGALVVGSGTHPGPTAAIATYNRQLTFVVWVSRTDTGQWRQLRRRADAVSGWTGLQPMRLASALAVCLQGDEGRGGAGPGD